MHQHSRIARGFLILACLLVVTCLAQRVAGLRALQLAVIAPQQVSQSLTQHEIKSDAPVSTCEFSAKSLTGALPLLAEAALLLLVCLFAMLAFPQFLIQRVPFLPERAPPRCRRHLQFCILRE